MKPSDVRRALPLLVVLIGGGFLVWQFGQDALKLNSVPGATLSPSATPSGEVTLTGTDGFINETPFSLQGPKGYKISVFARDLGSVRFMAFDPRSGALFATLRTEGRVVGLQDTDDDGKADQMWDVIDGLRNPHGIAIRDTWLYIAEEHQVGRVRLFAERDYQGIISNLPSGGGHVTRTIGFGPDGKLYVSIGSSCNACFESDERRASIMQYNPDGTGGRVFAKGLRNAVGFVWDAKGNMWATDNGRDQLGDDLPPEEVNYVFEELGEPKNYGWPICYGDRVHDTDFDPSALQQVQGGEQSRTTSSGRVNPCVDTEPPAIELPAHTAPLGLRFDKEGNLYVALHGSWNRTYPSGYKIIQIRFPKNFVPYEYGAEKKPKAEDFIWGWMSDEHMKKPLASNASQFAQGRPVDILFDDKGAMYISDDKAGMIYRVIRINQ